MPARLPSPLARPFATLLLLALLAAPTALRAQPVVILDDKFTDGERQSQSLPNSLAWYTPSAARVNLAVRNGALTLVANNNDRGIWGYFPALLLNVGDSLTLTIDFRFTVNQPNLGGPSLRFALCYTNGLAPRQSDGGLPTGNYQGYGNFTNAGDSTGGTRLRKRNGPAAASPTATLLEISDGPVDIAWDTFGAARSGLAGTFLANTPYTAVIKITRTGSDTATILTSLTGGTLSPNNTLIELDPSKIFSTFDTVALSVPDVTAAGDFLITRAQVVHDINSARISNLSLLTDIPTSGDSFTMGYVVGGSRTSGPKPLVIRAVGPSLGALGVAGTLDDPKLELFAGSTKTGDNDNWGGSSTIANAMTAVGAFAFAGPTSRDAAALANITTANNSVIVSAADAGTGSVIAEIYDATPAASFSASTPRLINVSVLKHLGPGVTMGFVVGGSGTKNVLVRAIGPTLGAPPFEVGGVVADPQLTLYSGPTTIGANDNWGGGPVLTAAFASVGAFALPATSRDAALLAALSPGNYTVQVTGVNTTTGTALVEVYEVP